MVKVSVIMPVYNASDYLEDSINGILNQSLKDLELICVDDGSKDNSLEILNDFAAKDSRVKVYHQENRGGGAARNVALSYATGEYLYCMDADDELDLNALKELYKIATKKDLDFIMFRATNYDVDTGVSQKIRYFRMDAVAEKVGESVFSYRDLGDLIFETSSTPWCKFYNLDFVKRTGAQFAEGLIFHDNIFWWDILLNGERIYFYKKYLYTRKNHSKSSTGAGDRRYIDSIKISDMIWEIFFRHNLFDEYKTGMGIRKFEKVYHWYPEIQPELREMYFQAMKEDYERIAADKEFYDYIIDDLTPKSKAIFLNTLASENHKQFDKKMENILLKEEIEELKEENEEIKSSKSWKITKPLRSIKNMFK